MNEQFWQLYRLVRDGGYTPHQSIQRRLWKGGRVVDCNDLFSSGPISLYHASHIRAALLSAARSEDAIGVFIPFWYRKEQPAEHINTIRQEVECEFPAPFRMYLEDNQRNAFLIGLYTNKELQIRERVSITLAITKRAIAR